MGVAREGISNQIILIRENPVGLIRVDVEASLDRQRNPARRAVRLTAAKKLGLKQVSRPRGRQRHADAVKAYRLMGNRSREEADWYTDFYIWKGRCQKLRGLISFEPGDVSCHA
jgi:hypothetical protein